MRRYPLPPPAMWPCDRPIVHVLNGDYPAAELRRMTVPGLERLVAKLVQRTSKSAARPQWWPRGLVFTHPIDLGLDDEREIKLAFKQVIVSCCQFFKADENRRRRPASDKQDFFAYFRLQARKGAEERPAPPPPPPTLKLANCVHVPFSSDVGRVMAAREQHGVSEDLRLRRLERSEWYTNKSASRAAEVEYEVAPYREPAYTHIYRMPRRQHRHKRRSLYDVAFLLRFCKPCSVRIERLDLSKVNCNSGKRVILNGDNELRRELVVKITDTEKIYCDVRRSVNVKLVRTSPRLRIV